MHRHAVEWADHEECETHSKEDDKAIMAATCGMGFGATAAAPGPPAGRPTAAVLTQSAPVARRCR